MSLFSNDDDDDATNDESVRVGLLLFVITQVERMASFSSSKKQNFLCNKKKQKRERERERDRETETERDRDRERKKSQLFNVSL